MSFLHFFGHLTNPGAAAAPQESVSSYISSFYVHTGVYLPWHSKSESLGLDLANIPGNTSLNYSDVQVWFELLVSSNQTYPQRTKKGKRNKRNKKRKEIERKAKLA